MSGDKVLEWELEPKIIFQKDFLDGRLITALNFTSEFEWEGPRPRHGEDFDGEMVWEITGGISYRVLCNWYVGLEGRYDTAFPNMDVRNQGDWAIFSGHRFTTDPGAWWATLTWLPQAVGWPNDNSRSSTLHFGEHERNEIRPKIGYDF